MFMNYVHTKNCSHVSLDATISDVTHYLIAQSLG